MLKVSHNSRSNRRCLYPSFDGISANTQLQVCFFNRGYEVLAIFSRRAMSQGEICSWTHLSAFLYFWVTSSRAKVYFLFGDFKYVFASEVHRLRFALLDSANKRYRKFVREDECEIVLVLSTIISCKKFWRYLANHDTLQPIFVEP